VESLHVGLYGSASFGALTLRGGVAYAHHEADMTRSIAFTGFSGTNRSTSSVDSLQAFGELGYMLQLNDNVAIEPFVGLAHVHVASRGVFEEGSAVAVTGEVHPFDVTYSTLGARLIASVSTDVGTITFKGMLGWRHAFGDTVPQATFSYASGSTPFLISGAPIDKDSLVVEAGLNWAVSEAVTLSASYTGAIGARDQEHTIRGGLTIRF
jgi:outer membrane autotransporter protein